MIESLPDGKAGGSTQKYLLYAIGEVSLVVIGILIALQINNWNESRKDRILERETLEEIAENISLNIQEFEDFTAGNEFPDRATDYVLAVLNGQRPYNDSLHYLINTAIYQRNNVQYSSVAYESLKNNNLNLIRNRELKKRIVGLFELTYPHMLKTFEWENKDALQNYMDQHFYPFSFEGGMAWQPYDFEVQMKDNYFKSLIAKVKIQRNYYIWMAQEPLEESKEILDLINQELAN